MLLPDRLTLMQRVQDAARNGYHHFTSGQTSIEKWPALSRKFAKLYATDLKSSTRCNWRRRGEAVTFAYGYQSPPYESPPIIRWVLLSTEGIGLVHAREHLQHMQGARLELDGYELVHDGKSWTWRMTKKRVQHWRDRIHAVASLHPERRTIGEDAAGKFDADAEAIQDALYNTPGFRLARQQVGKLVQFLRMEWKRLRPNTGIQPRVRTFLPYIQRLPNSKRASK